MMASNNRMANLPNETLAELKKAFGKSIVKTVDMEHELQSESVDLIISAVDKQRGNYEAAAKAVKEQMDKKYGPAWHCVIGEGFAFDVTYHTKNMIYVFYQGNIAILLYKC